MRRHAWNCDLSTKPGTDILTNRHIRTYVHTYIRTYVHTYIRTHINTYVHAYYLFTYVLALSHTIFHIPLCHTHTTVLTFRSFTTSFPFPSFSVPATTFDAHYWKKLTCGVIRSFNYEIIAWVLLLKVG